MNRKERRSFIMPFIYEQRRPRSTSTLCSPNTGLSVSIYLQALEVFFFLPTAFRRVSTQAVLLFITQNRYLISDILNRI